MDEKVYSQEVVPSNPFPGQPLLTTPTTQSNPSGVFTQTETKNKVFPTKRTAVELLSTALNTRSRKILEEFQLQQSGGLRIGDFQEGISGDLKITPNGITARDRAGLTTFAIDGTDGSAVFRGSVQAADFIIADENGLVSAANFQSDSYRSDSTVTINLTFSNTLVAGSELEFTLVRPSKVLITFFANVSINIIDSFQNYNINVGVSIDGSNPFAVGQDYSRFETEGIGSGVMGSCLSFAKTFLLSSGNHEISMHWSALSDTTVDLNTRGLDYCMLGS